MSSSATGSSSLHGQRARDGAYSFTRNPLYFFSFLGFADVGLVTETMTLALALIAFFAVVYPFIVRREEAYLYARHGAQFEAYCSRVPRFIPRLTGYWEPGSWLVDTRLFRRTSRRGSRCRDPRRRVDRTASVQ